MVLELAGCIIRDKAGRILLLHRNTSERQHWEIPGGKVEPGEDTAETAVREAKEELGVPVKIEKLLGSKEFTEDSMRMRYTWYQAKITSGQPKILEPDIFDDMHYFSLDEMQAAILSAGAEAFIVMLKDEYDS